jgi:hypothetical protein
MATVDWSIKGPHFVNCDCDYGCPCQFNALPTYRTCLALVAWRIEEGHCGDVSLDGLLASTPTPGRAPSTKATAACSRSSRRAPISASGRR